MIDVCVIGGGPSGMTAALYALRSGLSVAMIEQGAPGGQLLKTEQIDNYPGFAQGVLGFDLANAMYGQISGFPDFQLVNDTAKKVSKKDKLFQVEISTGNVEAKAVIIATGGYPRSLSVPGEREYQGKGVSYCAICDGFFFKGKKVAVVGGGNTALEDAIYLTSIASEVYLIHRRDQFRGSQILVDKLPDYPNLHVLMETIPLEIKGESKVTEMVLENLREGHQQTIAVDGVFVAVGQIMNSSFVKNILNTNDADQIIVSDNMETNVPGLFACGDVVAKNLRQVSTAVGDGAVAGQMAYEYISNL